MIAQHGEMLAKALSTQTDLRVVVVNCPSLASHGVWQGWSLKPVRKVQERLIRLDHQSKSPVQGTIGFCIGPPILSMGCAAALLTFVPHAASARRRRVALSGYASGTSVLFPCMPRGFNLCLSSSGGGLPGRPQTRKSRDACLIFGRDF
jgi:hypothetical protein